MKTLSLIILLTSAICYGQDFRQLGRPFRIQADTSSPIGQARWHPQIITLEDMDAYWQECWNDSTSQTFHISLIGGNEYTSLCPREYGEACIDPGISPAFRGHRTIYTHREPTFAGFREWMRRKK
jgi:hypothetical protein